MVRGQSNKALKQICSPSPPQASTQKLAPLSFKHYIEGKLLNLNVRQYNPREAQFMVDQSAINKALAHKQAMQVIAQTASSQEIKQAANAILDCMEWLDSNFDDLQTIFNSIREQKEMINLIAERLHAIDGRGTL